MRTAILALLGLTLSASVKSQPAGGLPVVVTAQWLLEHHREPDLTVLHVAFSRREFIREHIPGSRFIWFSWLSPSTPDGSTEMAPLPEAKRALEDLGLTPRSRIVVTFAGTNLSTTTRTIFALHYFGFEGRVALLDGGLEAWKRAGGAVTKQVDSVSRSSLLLEPRPELLVDAAFVRQHLGDPAFTIVDARSKNFYDGSAAGVRPGHIRGAVSLPYSSVVDSLNQMKNREALEAVFHAAGVRTGTTVVAYCHVGQQATVVLQAAHLLGYAVRLYDGSYDEWSSLDEATYPVEQTPITDKP